MKIILAGIGMGAREQMTVAVQESCRQADIIFGAGKVLSALTWCRVRKEPLYEADKILHFLGEHREYTRPVVVFSGDTGFYSGARRFQELCKDKDEYVIETLAGITTVQAFAARLGTTWQDIRLCSIHGRSCSLMNELRCNPRVFCLASGAQDVRRISRELLEYGYGAVRMTVAMNLTCADESITQGAPEDFLEFDKEGLCAFLLEREKDDRSLPYGLPDDFFIRGRAPMTKEEVRAVSVAKLHLTQDAVVYDIGAGTGSVSIECALHLTQGEVYAIERKEEAVELLHQNVRKASADHVHVIHGSAPEALEGLPAPTHVFIGGSSGRMADILDAVRAANPAVRIVVNAITLETQSALTEYIRSHELMDADIVTIQASHSEVIAGYHMMRGENPVMICSFGGK